MKLIRWHLDTGLQGGDRTGEIEVEDNATDTEIETAVREDMWDRMSLTWSVGKEEMDDVRIYHRLSNRVGTGEVFRLTTPRAITMKDIVEYLSDMRWDIPGPIRQGALDEIDRLRAELAAKDARIAASATELSDLYKKYDDCRETLLEVSKQLSISEHDNEALRKELAEVTADHKAMAEYALKLDASNDDYQAELAAKDARIARLEAAGKKH